MRIGEVAERAGVPAKTIRYYETIGLLPAPDRAANGYRDYADGIIDRLAFVRAAQVSGLTLAEIRSIVAFRNRGETPCAHVHDLIGQRAADIDQRILELQETRAELARLAERALQLNPADCSPASICHIITTPGRHGKPVARTPQSG